MKLTTIPMISGLALAAMTAAGVSHWWSVRSFVSLIDAGIPIPSEKQPPSPLFLPTQDKSVPPKPIAIANKQPASESTTEETQKVFFETLNNFNKKFEALQNQNRDLLDQVAETNRDVMKLEFRVDTHSESFRPMPVSEDQSTSLGDSPGVLPSRAEALFLPSSE
jgi:hypothetical protein